MLWQHQAHWSQAQMLTGWSLPASSLALALSNRPLPGHKPFHHKRKWGWEDS